MRSAISLARAFDDPKPRKIREVVADTEVPQSFASQILADLVRAGLASSKAGREGGYRLTRPPAEISVLEVIEASEGPLRSNRCALGEGPCRWDSVCPLHETWTEATSVLRDLLERTDLATLAARDRDIEEGAYPTPGYAHRARPTAVPVEDGVQIELPLPAVEAGLRGAERHLGRIVRDAARTALADGAGGARPPRVSEVSLSPAGTARSRPGGAGYLLGWRVDAPPAAGRLEADLSVASIDPERSEIRVEGTWYHDSLSGPAPVAVELQATSGKMMRMFLRGLAGLLERPAVGPVRR